METTALKDPDFLAACKDARVLPERCFFCARTNERNIARRMVCYRLLHRGWKPGCVAKLLQVSTRQVRHWSSTAPARFNVHAWKERHRRTLFASLLNFRF